MSYQISPPFDPEFIYASNRGQMEVPIVDVDIEPDPGHINPFRVGANRNAEKRHYHVYFDLTKGNMVDLNPVLKNKYFRHLSNRRAGGAFTSTGPLGGGTMSAGVLWLRYYAPDKNLDGSVDPLAGVALPKITMRLDTGEVFWIQADFSMTAQRQLKIIPGTTKEPVPVNTLPFLGPTLGWFKIFGLYLIRLEANGYMMSDPFGPYPPAILKKNIRDDHACFDTKGKNLLPPGNIAHSATDCPYNSYLTRPLQFENNKVYVFTGKMPTTPKTRNGETTMTSAEARYWSICHTGSGPDNLYNGVVYGCLIDEEIIVDNSNHYIIVYSINEAQRPVNAKSECGVTWQELGPETRQGFPIRWMSVYPSHYMEENKDYAPHDLNIPWKTGAWSETLYNKALVGNNTRGVMGDYHPIIHHLTKSEFEALGCPDQGIDIKDIPEWKWE